MNWKTEKSSPKVVPPYKDASNFIFTVDDLSNTPSRRCHGIRSGEELALRRKGTCFIRELVKRMNSREEEKSHRNKCVAMIYFHRFYMYHSLGTFQPTYIATACLFLASKCEECPRKLSEFSQYMHAMLYPDLKALVEEELEIVNEAIIALETCILRTLAFELIIALPHIDILQAPFSSEGDVLRKKAFGLATDILTVTTLCLLCESKTLAAACYYIASRNLNINMEANYGVEWFKKLDASLTPRNLHKIVDVFRSGLAAAQPIVEKQLIPPPPPFPRPSSPPQLKPLHPIQPLSKPIPNTSIKIGASPPVPPLSLPPKPLLPTVSPRTQVSFSNSLQPPPLKKIRIVKMEEVELEEGEIL